MKTAVSIPNKILYHQGGNPVQVNLMLDRVYTIFGNTSAIPDGGIEDFIGELTLRKAIHYQFEENLVWLQAVDYRDQKPYIVAKYIQGTWHFYPEGLPHNV